MNFRGKIMENFWNLKNEYKRIISSNTNIYNNFYYGNVAVEKFFEKMNSAENRSTALFWAMAIDEDYKYANSLLGKPDITEKHLQAEKLLKSATAEELSVIGKLESVEQVINEKRKAEINALGSAYHEFGNYSSLNKY